MGINSSSLIAMEHNLGDRSRFAKLGMAINDVLNQASRDVLQSEIHPSDIEEKVNSISYKKQMNPKMNPDQDCLLKSAKTSGYEKFDISLTYKLIRNICLTIPKPTNGKWGENILPPAGYVTVGDDIERIRLIRHSVIAFVMSGYSKEVEFNNTWSMISDICQRLETFTGKKYLKNLKDIQKLAFRVETEFDLMERIRMRMATKTDSCTLMASVRKLLDRSRFAKLEIAINDVLSQACRDILELEIPPSDIHSRMNSFSNKMRINLKIHPYHEILLREAGHSGYKRFDILLTYKLIRNICSHIPKPTKGKWGEEPAAGEVTVGDDIERIRLIRNTVSAHATSASISETEYDNTWSTITDICRRLETFTGEKYLESLNDIQKLTFREETDDDFIEKIKLEQKKQAIKEENISLSREAFENELRHGSCKIRQVRIMVVGHYGVGKTTLTYGFIGKDKKGIESTDGIDLFRARCRIERLNDESRKWSVVTGNLMTPAALAAAPNVLTSNKRRSKGISDEAPEINKKKIVMAEDNQKQIVNQTSDPISTTLQTITPISKSANSTSKKYAQFETDNIGIDQCAKYEHPFIEVEKRGKYSSEFFEKSQKARATNLEDRMKDIFIDLWDFGGQNVFYTTHQSFLTSRCIYLLVINCAKDLNAALKDRALYPSQQAKPKVEDFIDFWISTITDYANNDKPGFPRIILIGTHVDELGNNAPSRVKQVCLQIKKRYQCLVDKGQLVINEDLFLNAKDTNGEKHAFIREFIMQEAKLQPHWEELFPKSWLHLLDFIVTKREQGFDILTLKEITEFNQNAIVPLTEFSLENMLQRQHEIGDIIFFNTRMLKDIIILDPSFLIRALKSLISTRGHMEKAGMNAEIWRNLSTTGIVSEDTIKDIWSNYPLLHKYADIFLGVFQHMDIIVKPKLYVDVEVNVHQEKIFFIPCMIEESDSIERVEKFLESSKELYEFYDISINNGTLVPPAIGYRLLSFCTSMWPVVEGRLFTACGFFRLDLHHILILKIFSSNIRVYVVHRRSRRSISAALYNSVNRTLISFLEACFLQFHNNLAVVNGFREMEDSALSQETPNCKENCPGIGHACHGKIVEEVELSRLVRYLSPTHLYPLGVELGILSREIERIEKDHKSSIDQMFFVLLEWRKKLHSSFSDLEEALKRCNIDIHVLCEVCKTSVFETDVMRNIPPDILDKVLSDQELDEVAGYIGREYLQLCLQLGHSVSHIERVMDENKYNFLEGIRVLLRDWRKSGQLKPTVKMLGCAWLQCGMDFNVFYNLVVKQEKDLWQLPIIS